MCCSAVGLVLFSGAVRAFDRGALKQFRFMTVGKVLLYNKSVGQRIRDHRLSVLIYSYNRHEFLRRQILYWADKPVDLLIADGSQNPMKTPEAERQGQFCLIYHHSPGPRNVNSRMKWLSTHASTPHVVFLDDQDTFLWSAAIRLMDFLDNSVEYASASGATFCRYTKYQFWHYDTHGFDINKAGVGARVIDAWGRSAIVRCAYSVMRASVAQQVYSFRPAVDFDNEGPSDLLFLVSAMVAGKHIAFTLPALWRLDGSQTREYWRASLGDGEVSADKIRLSEAIEQMCFAYGVAQADREVIFSIIAGVWSDQEAAFSRVSVEPTWLEARVAELKAFTRIRSRIKQWMRKDRDVQPLEYFRRMGGLEQDQIEDLQNLQAILAKYPLGVSAT